MRKLLFALLLVGIICARARANTITAATCTLTAVQNAITSTLPGDTVLVPAGTCDWSGGLSITGISLIGAGKSALATVITAGTVTMSKHATQHTRVSGFRFTGTDQHITVNGNPTDKAFIVDNNYLFTNGSRMMYITASGGLIHHNDFAASATGTSGDVFNIQTSEDWSQPPTFGNQDTTGERNIYFEDNTFTYILETAPDGDVGSRLVFRHNTWTDSSIVFHGGSPADSSPGGGTRQFEIYNNTFRRVDANAAVNKWIWVRGSSGVIANNTMDVASSSQYPNKIEIRLSLACPTAYPVQYQTGQSNATAENPPSHPVLIFGNTGAGTSDAKFITVDSSDTAGGSCATPANYIQVNRDYYTSNHWNWTPYIYPHPLTQGGTAPAAPTGVSAVVH